MKLKKALIITIISIILINIPIATFAWTTRDTTYEICNIINVCISGTMKIVAWVIAIIYIVKAIKYVKVSKEEPQQKIKNIQTSLIITILEIVILVFGASWVIDIGMETYNIGEAYKVFEINKLIPNFMRIIAFVLFLFYIIKSIIYFASSEEDNHQKVKHLIKWQIVTATIFAILLILSKNIL